MKRPPFAAPVSAFAAFALLATLAALAVAAHAAPAVAAADRAAAAAAVNDLFPRPVSAVCGAAAAGGQPQGEPWVALRQDFDVDLAGVEDPLVLAASPRLVAILEARTGMHVFGGGAWRLTIDCGAPAGPVQRAVEDESYTLRIEPAGARLTAPTPYGILRGVETFIQLAKPGPDGWRLPVCAIEDRPRFPWRGLLLDSCRHFLQTADVFAMLNAMSAAKLNVLHWHLTEDQGFRVESRVFPELHQQGSDWHFYTQDEIRQVVGYAAELGIRVVPEFDVPGHTTSWLVSHPELSAFPGPYEIERHWGVFDPVLDPTREEVYDFLDRFLGEMATLFPDPYVHIGGDEVNGVQWNTSEAVKEFKRAHQLDSNEALQAWFNRRLLAILQKHGKSMIGWDEILQPDLPKDAIIQSWRGADSLAKAAQGGWRCLLSSGWYLDHAQPASKHYGVDPHAGPVADLPDDARARVLGGEACMWTEFVTYEMLDGRVWPRAGAIAERLWSPVSVTDVDDMYRRLAIFSARLELQGLRHVNGPRLMLQRLAGGPAAPALTEFASLLEPVKNYARGSSREYDQWTPLNRLVDAVVMESDAARKFGRAVDRLLADPQAAGDREALRRRLTAWRDMGGANGELTAAIAAAPMLAEAAPLAADLSALGDLGLRALDAWPGGKKLKLTKVDWDVLARVGEPRAELLLMVGPHVVRLVEAAVKGRP